MPVLDLDALKATRLQTDPFDYLVTPGLVRVDALSAINQDFPEVPGPGSYPPVRLNICGQFAQLLRELEGVEFQNIMSQKFDLDLAAYPTMFTVRGHCRVSDGKIHRDSETKIITVLLYLNPPWDAEGGRLRLLRGPDDLDDVVTEVAPNGGAMLAFRRCGHSWHGHEPYAGQRRAVQMNWVLNAGVVMREEWRHRLSAAARKLISFS